MPDREKVIKALEICIPLGEGEMCPPECPYFVCTGYSKVMRDALALLKEQDDKDISVPIKIVRKQGKCENSDGSIDYFCEWYCPHCGKLLVRGFDAPRIEFCYKCGKAVKWE
jgi:hypothetical protein